MVIKYIMKATKVVDGIHVLSKKRGGGLLRREVWVDRQGRVARYNLAYVNHEMFQGDNGRVLGYDNQHGYHHRHYCGEVTAVEWRSFEDTEERFQAEWFQLLKSRKST
jgi:hypothetical protein